MQTYFPYSHIISSSSDHAMSTNNHLFTGDWQIIDNESSGSKTSLAAISEIYY